jgi:hypothetical protein
MQDVTTPARRGGRTTVTVLATVLAIVLAVAGLAALGADALQRAEGGYFTSSTERLSTPTSALVTDEILVEAGRPGDSPTDVGDLAEVRIRATPAERGTAMFVGIGPKVEVETYLRGVAHDRMASFELDPFAVRFDRATGGPAPAPAAAPFWVATASGHGTRTVLWEKEQGAWSAVVMNIDGSPGVDIRADIGLRFEFLLPLGVALLGAGLLLVAASVPARRRSRR